MQYCGKYIHSSKARFDKHTAGHFKTYATLHNNYHSLEIARHIVFWRMMFWHNFTVTNDDLFLCGMHAKIFADISVCVVR